MLRRLGVTSALLLMLLAGSDVHALNMTLGDVDARNLGSFGFTATNSFLSFDAGATDQLYQMYAYLGNASDTVTINGTYFSVDSAITQVSPGVATSSLLLNGTGATALGLTAGALRVDYIFTLDDDTSANDFDSLLWDVSVTNLGGVDVDLSLYQYLDLDLNGTFNDDSAVANNSLIAVSDATDPFVFQWKAANGGSADHFAVNGYPTVRSLLNGMGAAADLSDTTASFGPGDFTGAFQYDFLLTPGATRNLGGSAVAAPEPGSAPLAMLGLAGLAFVSRRRDRPAGRRC